MYHSTVLLNELHPDLNTIPDILLQVSDVLKLPSTCSALSRLRLSVFYFAGRNHAQMQNMLGCFTKLILDTSHSVSHIVIEVQWDSLGLFSTTRSFVSSYATNLDPELSVLQDAMLNSAQLERVDFVMKGPIAERYASAIGGFLLPKLAVLDNRGILHVAGTM